MFGDVALTMEMGADADADTVDVDKTINLRRRWMKVSAWGQRYAMTDAHAACGQVSQRQLPLT